MFLKYFVRVDDQITLALKYDTTNSIVTLGGNVRYQIIMEEIINEAFERHPKVKPTYPQINKMRFDFRKKNTEFRKALQYMRDTFHYVLEETTNLQNIMR